MGVDKTDLRDSPVSTLPREEVSLSGDLLLISKRDAEKSEEFGIDKYRSCGIDYIDLTKSIVSSMGRTISGLVQNELSDVLGGHVTLTTWKHVEAE